MKVAVISLCVQAGVGVRTFYDALQGTYTVRPDTLSKLNLALARFKMSYAGDPGPISVHACYRAALVIAAFQLKADARAVMFSDPGRKATADDEWRDASRVRQLAFWIANGLLGFPQADIARAAGVTRQAVSKAIEKLEDDAGPDVRRAMKALEEVFS